VARVESTSFISTLSSREREALLDQVRTLASELPDPIPFPYTTEVEIFERS
jgi:hypothetical protein